MKNKEALLLAEKGLDAQFNSLKKEINSYKYVLDVSTNTLSRLVGDKTKARKLHNELVDTLGHKYIGAEDGFIAMANTSKLGRATQIINKYTNKVNTSQLLETRTEARSKLVIQRSRQAGARVKSEVDRHMEDISKYTSPSLVLKVKAKNKAKIDKLNLHMQVPRGRKFNKLERAARTALTKGIKYGQSEEVQDILALKADLIRQLVRKGKASTRGIKYTKTRKQQEKAGTSKYQAYGYDVVTEEASGGRESSHLDIMATLSSLLVPTISDTTRGSRGVFAAMRPSGSYSSPGYLRYQTGRFADSADVDYVIEGANNTVDIGFSYMKYPYDVFKGPKHGPGRDPANIVSSAIREIMQKYFTDVKIRGLIPL